MVPLRRPARSLAAVLGTLALLLAACGGDDSPELEDAGPEIASAGADGTDAGDSADATDESGTDGDQSAAGIDGATDGATDGGDPADGDPADGGEDADDTADDTGDDQPAVGGGDAAFPTPAAVSGEPAFTTASKLTTVGLDDVFFGDTVSAIRDKVPGDWVGLPAAGSRPSCFTMQPAGGPEGTVLMILDGRVERIDIASPDITTRSGIGVGSTTDEIVDLFEANIDRAAVDGGEDIVFIPTDEVDRDFRIIWTTDGTTVTAMRAGRVPGVLAAAPCG